MTFLLCDPGWYVHKPDVQNKWDVNTHTHTHKTYLGHEALRQAHLPIREGDLGLTSSSSIKGTAYIGCPALILGRAVAASARGNLPSLLDRLPERPMALELIEELKTVATEAKRSQIEDAVDSSWAALAAEEDPQGRGIGTLLVE